MFSTPSPKTKLDIWVLPLTGNKKPFPYLNGDSNEDLARLSPDGRWIAYESDQTGKFEVYVATFSGDSSAPRGNWQVSTNGGTRPVWGRDGKQLYFVSADRKMMAAAVSGSGGARFEFNAPRALFEARISGNPWDQFDVSQDGRFLMPVPAQQDVSTPITLVVNWRAGLKK